MMCNFVCVQDNKKKKDAGGRGDLHAASARRIGGPLCSVLKPEPTDLTVVAGKSHQQRSDATEQECSV